MMAARLAPPLSPAPRLNAVQPRYPGAIELMAQAARGQRPAQLAVLAAIGAGMERTLYRVLGPDAPLEPLLEAALLRALNHAAHYAGDEPLAVWADRIAVQVATTYRGGARPAQPAPPSPLDDASRVRTLLSRVHARLLHVRPDEHIAFALLDLDGRPLLDAACLTQAAPIVVRQRADRARRQLLLAARRDHTLAAYLQLSERLRALAARLQRERPAARPSPRARRLHETVVSALHAVQH